MAKHFDNLDETFEITPEVEVLKPTKKQKDALIISDKSEDKEKDYQTARAQLHNLVDKMQEALDGALEVAQESDHARAYEVVFQGAKHTADVVEKLADLQKKMKDLDKVEEVNVQQTNVQNNVYMQGTTEDIMKMLKDSQKDK